MPNDDTLWTCPKCGHQEGQPASVASMWHPCPRRGGRPVELAPASAADCGECTHRHADHMHRNPRRLCRRCMCVGYTRGQR